MAATLFHAFMNIDIETAAVSAGLASICVGVEVFPIGTGDAFFD